MIVGVIVILAFMYTFAYIIDYKINRIEKKIDKLLEDSKPN